MRVRLHNPDREVELPGTKAERLWSPPENGDRRGRADPYRQVAEELSEEVLPEEIYGSPGGG